MQWGGDGEFTGKKADGRAGEELVEGLSDNFDSVPVFSVEYRIMPISDEKATYFSSSLYSSHR